MNSMTKKMLWALTLSEDKSDVLEAIRPVLGRYGIKARTLEEANAALHEMDLAPDSVYEEEDDKEEEEDDGDLENVTDSEEEAKQGSPKTPMFLLPIPNAGEAGEKSYVNKRKHQASIVEKVIHEAIITGETEVKFHFDGHPILPEIREGLEFRGYAVGELLNAMTHQPTHGYSVSW